MAIPHRPNNQIVEMDVLRSKRETRNGERETTGVDIRLYANYNFASLHRGQQLRLPTPVPPKAQAQLARLVASDTVPSDGAHQSHRLDR
jgi:hypothetical protein